MLSKHIIKIQMQVATVNPGSDNTAPLHFPKCPSTNKPLVKHNDLPTIVGKSGSTSQYDSSIPLSSSPMTERFIHNLSTRLTTY